MKPTALIFTGPESTGKTTLAEKLSNFYGVPLAEEFARAYLSGKPTGNYTLTDLNFIAEGQIKAQNKAQQIATENKKLFYVCDTDLITLKIWSEEVFGTCDKLILKNLDMREWTLDNGIWKQKFKDRRSNVQGPVRQQYPRRRARGHCRRHRRHR